MLLAATYGQLGKKSAAVNALRRLLALYEGFRRTGREWLAKWFEPSLVEDLIDGLRKAGLELPATDA